MLGVTKKLVSSGVLVACTCKVAILMRPSARSFLILLSLLSVHQLLIVTSKTGRTAFCDIDFDFFLFNSRHFIFWEDKTLKHLRYPSKKYQLYARRIHCDDLHMSFDVWYPPGRLLCSPIICLSLSRVRWVLPTFGIWLLTEHCVLPSVGFFIAGFHSCCMISPGRFPFQTMFWRLSGPFAESVWSPVPSYGLRHITDGLKLDDMVY